MYIIDMCIVRFFLTTKCGFVSETRIKKLDRRLVANTVWPDKILIKIILRNSSSENKTDLLDLIPFPIQCLVQK